MSRKRCTYRVVGESTFLRYHEIDVGFGTRRAAAIRHAAQLARTDFARVSVVSECEEVYCIHDHKKRSKVLCRKGGATR